MPKHIRNMLRYLISAGGCVIVLIGTWNYLWQEEPNILIIAAGILAAICPWLLFTKNDKPLG